MLQHFDVLFFENYEHRIFASKKPGEWDVPSREHRGVHSLENEIGDGMNGEIVQFCEGSVRGRLWPAKNTSGRSLLQA